MFPFHPKFNHKPKYKCKPRKNTHIFGDHHYPKHKQHCPPKCPKPPPPCPPACPPGCCPIPPP